MTTYRFIRTGRREGAHLHEPLRVTVDVPDDGGPRHPHEPVSGAAIAAALERDGVEFDVFDVRIDDSADVAEHTTRAGDGAPTPEEGARR